MVDTDIATDTFLIALYTCFDDFCRDAIAIAAGELAPETPHPGPTASLSRSEVVTLSVFGQLARFSSERDFYRFAHRNLRHLFPRLPDRSQFNRLQAQHQDLTAQFALGIARQLSTREALGVPAYEVLDRCGVAMRWCGRRGRSWMPEIDKGRCSRLGWFEGFHLLTCVTEVGVISGWGFGAASAKDQPQADVFLQARHVQYSQYSQYSQSFGDCWLPTVGMSLSDGDYVMDKGFVGEELHARWLHNYGVHAIVCPPQSQRRRCGPKSSPQSSPQSGLEASPKTEANAQSSAQSSAQSPEQELVDCAQRRWPAGWHRLCASWRQIVETAHEKLLNFCRLESERAHCRSGFAARLSAKIALHNFCIWLNWKSGRKLLEFVELVSW